MTPSEQGFTFGFALGSVLVSGIWYIWHCWQDLQTSKQGGR